LPARHWLAYTASLSKQLTAACAAPLARRGALDMQGAVVGSLLDIDFLPRFPAAYRHRTGRPNRWEATLSTGYLVFLARYLEHRLHTTSLAWWELPAPHHAHSRPSWAGSWAGSAAPPRARLFCGGRGSLRNRGLSPVRETLTGRLAGPAVLRWNRGKL
jgi:hypothetical protein